MPNIDISLDELTQAAIAAMVANTSTPLALTPGDPLLALMEAGCAADLMVVAGLQAAIRLSRLTSSTGSDLDNYLLGFDFPRLQALAATGTVTFHLDSSYLSSHDIAIPPGVQVTSSQGSVVFLVVADTANPYWDSGQSAYFIPSGSSISQLSIPVLASVTGSQGNTASGGLSALVTPVQGVNVVSNDLAITNGKDVEADQDYIARFQTFMLSLGQGTQSAILAACQSVLGAAADVLLLEGVQKDGLVIPCSFQVIAEDGSGTLPPVTKSLIYTAVDKVRALGVSFSVDSPNLTLLPVSIAMIYDNAFVGSKTQADGAISAEISSIINSNRIGQKIYYSDFIYQVMRLSSLLPIIRAVESVTLGSYTDVDYPTASVEVVRLSGVPVITSTFVGLGVA